MRLSTRESRLARRAVHRLGAGACLFALLAACTAAPPDEPPESARAPRPVAPLHVSADERSLPSAEALRLTLGELRARILELHNLPLAAEALRVDEARAREREAQLRPNPYVLLRKRRVDDLDFTGTGSTELELGQPIELGGQRSARAKLARAEAEVVSEEVRALTARTLRDAEQRFCTLLRLELDLAEAREAARVAEELATLAAERVESGKESRIALLRFEAAATDARLEAEDLERRRERGCRELDELIGAPSGTVAGADGALDTGELVASASDLEAARERLAHHPRLVAAEGAAEVARRALDSAEADVWPDLTVAVTYEHDQDLDRDYSGLLLKLPLPAWDRNQGRRDEARAAQRRASRAIEAELLALDVELSSAWLDHRRAERNLAGYDEEILPRLEEAFALTRSAFDAGRVSWSGVLDAHLALIAAKRARLDHLEARGRAAAQLRYLTDWREGS